MCTLTFGIQKPRYAEIKISFEMTKAGPRNAKVENYALVIAATIVPRNIITAELI